MKRLFSELFCGADRTRIPSDVRDNECEEQGFHRHQCDRCGTVWKHRDDVMHNCSDKEHRIGHTCPVCGTTQHYKMLSDRLKQRIMEQSDGPEREFGVFVCELLNAIFNERR